MLYFPIFRKSLRRDMIRIRKRNEQCSHLDVSYSYLSSTNLMFLIIDRNIEPFYKG